MDAFNEKKVYRTKSLWLPIAFAIIMLTADIWLLEKTLKSSETSLPKLKVNVFEASSFILQSTPRLIPQTTEPQNILFLGQPGAGNPAPELTDTIFIARLESKEKNIKIISIPRDLAVKTNNGQNITKINALWQLGSGRSEKEGLHLIQDKVEEISGLKINYFVLFDLGVVEQIVDGLGGINVNVKKDIYDPRFPAAGGGYETFALKSGLRYLDGGAALRFVRTRATPRGDFERIEHHQEVLKAIKGKIISLNPAWNFSSLWKIFQAVQKNVRTNLTFKNIVDLWSLAQATDLEKIKALSLEPESGLVKPAEMSLGGQKAYILLAEDQPYDYAKIRKTVANFINNNNDQSFGGLR